MHRFHQLFDNFLFVFMFFSFYNLFNETSDQNKNDWNGSESRRDAILGGKRSGFISICN